MLPGRQREVKRHVCDVKRNMIRISRPLASCVGSTSPFEKGRLHTPWPPWWMVTLECKSTNSSVLMRGYLRRPLARPRHGQE